MYKKFFHYVLPSMFAFAFSGLYTIVDGFFIGRNVGDTGLAAICIAFPLAAFIQAVGTGIGMGGAIWISICRGKKENESEKQFLGNTLGLLLISGILMALLLSFLYRPILSALGAKGDVLEAACSYLRIIALGGLFQVLATGLTPLLRNYNQSLLAMITMVSGFITNIIFDWLFVAVLSYGMAGAAFATILGQAVTILPGLLFLLKKVNPRLETGLKFSHYKWKRSTVFNIAKVGFSPFGLTMSPFLVIIIINKYAVIYGGDASVSAYSVITYIAAIVYLLLQGISDGCQPLISLSLGEGHLADAKKIRSFAYGFSLCTSLVVGGIILLAVPVIPTVFGASSEAAAIAVQGFPFFIGGFLFVAFARVTTSYFYATKKNGFAYLMVYGEPFLLSILLLCFLPSFGNVEGIWFLAFMAQILLSVVGFLLITSSGKQEKNRLQQMISLQ